MDILVITILLLLPCYLIQLSVTCLLMEIIGFAELIKGPIGFQVVIILFICLFGLLENYF